MVSPIDRRLTGAPPEVQTQNLLRFAERLAEQISGGQGRLNTNDPDAITKLFQHVDRSGDEFERQTGIPKIAALEDVQSTVSLAEENERLMEQIRRLGANPRTSGVGIGKEFLTSTNAALRNQLATLEAPLRRDAPLPAGNAGPSVAEIQSQIGPGATRFIFPDSALVENPTGGGFAGFARDFFTPIVGLPESDIQNLPTPLRPVVRGAQTVSSPGSVLATIGAPIGIGASGVAQGTGRLGTAARFVGETPGRAVLGELGAEIAAEGAREAGAPLPLQIAAGVGGGFAGALTPNVAGAVRRQGTDILPVGTARAAGPDDVPGGLADDLVPEREIVTERARLESRLEEISLQVEADTGTIRRPRWATGLTDQELRAVARQEGVDPTRPDWADGLDPVVIREARQRAFRNPNEPTRAQLRSEAQQIRQRLSELPAAEQADPLSQADLARSRQIEEGQFTDFQRTALDEMSDAELDQLFGQELAAARNRLDQGVQPGPAAEGVITPQRAEVQQTASEAASLQRGVDNPGGAFDEASSLQARLIPEDEVEQALDTARQRPKPHVESGSPDVGNRVPPPRRPRGRQGRLFPEEPGVPTPETDDSLVRFGRVMASRRRGTGLRASSIERMDQAALRQHEASLNIAERQARTIVDEGNRALRQAGLGRGFRGTVVPRNLEEIAEWDSIYRALHGEADAPPQYAALVDDLRQKMDFETQARLDFDPEMATVEDYFYRGWKVPKGIQTNSQGRLVHTPAFKKPRVNASYSELRELGFEPLFWNPYEQWRTARLQGIRYREQMQLVDILKQTGPDFIQQHSGGPIPEGWRVPEVGPAFEGKSVIIAQGNNVVPGKVRRYIVPDRIATSLEGVYGKRPNLGKISVGSKDVDVAKAIDWLVFTPKRAKLLGSFFQQVDFATRAGIGSTHAFLDNMLRGRPDLAIRAGIQYPITVADMIRANFSPGRRAVLRAKLDSPKPLVKGRNISWKGVSEQGLSIRDVSLVPPDIDQIAREAAESNLVTRPLRGIREAIGGIERANRRGLFEGVYPAAILSDGENNVIPFLVRNHPELSDVQIEARAAAILNTKYSTLPETMSVIQNRFMRQAGRWLAFSMNENEGLLKQATKTFTGADKRYWTTHWAAAYLFLMGVANAIHLAGTGQPLPADRYVPLTSRGYNTKFASPNLPWFNAGRNELPVTVDIVGQMDTAFRVIDPRSFVESRTSVPVSAAANQWAGEDFFGGRIDDVGPGGVVSRTIALANDMAAPIGAGPPVNRIARQHIPGASRAIPGGETNLSLGGLGLQASGVNLRGLRWAELEELKLESPEMLPNIEREQAQRRIDWALNDIRNETSIFTTTNSLRARLREARELGYEEAVGPLESELRRRGASTTNQRRPLFR